MADTDPDRIENTIELRAPRARVWRAISTTKDFATWFGLGEPLELAGDYAPGAKVMGVWRTGGKEVREVFCTVEQVEPERLLVFRWVPYELAPGEDAAAQPTTRIEMRLEDISGGTRLTVVESGFAALPASKQYKRDANGEGWAIQVQAIAAHVLGGVTVRVGDRIARPPAQVLEATVDPRRMAQYFISRGSARMTPGAHVTWEWTDVGASCSVRVHRVDDTRVEFVWAAAGGTPSLVRLALAPDGDGTQLTATEQPFALTDDGVARALQQTQGWTHFCCCLKAYLEHGIDLRRGKRADDVA